MNDIPHSPHEDDLPFFESKGEIFQWACLLISIVLSCIFAPWWLTLILVILAVIVVAGSIWEYRIKKKLKRQLDEKPPSSANPSRVVSPNEEMVANVGQTAKKGHKGMSKIDVLAAAVVAEQMYMRHKNHRNATDKKDGIDELKKELEDIYDDVVDIDEPDDDLDDEFEDIDNDSDEQDDIDDMMDAEQDAEMNNRFWIFDADNESSFSDCNDDWYEY